MTYGLKEKSVASLRGNTFYWTNEKKGCPALVFLPGLTADHTLFEKQLEWMCRMFPDSLLRSSMAKACGKTEYAQKKMLAMLSAYSKKELCRLMYLYS